MSMQTEFPFVWSRETREQRKAAMLGAITRSPGMSLGAVGERIGLKKTPYLRSMMIELLHDGLVVYEWATYTNGIRGMIFYLAGAEEQGNDR